MVDCGYNLRMHWKWNLNVRLQSVWSIAGCILDWCLEDDWNRWMKMFDFFWKRTIRSWMNVNGTTKIKWGVPIFFIPDGYNCWLIWNPVFVFVSNYLNMCIDWHVIIFFNQMDTAWLIDSKSGILCTSTHLPFHNFVMLLFSEFHLR